MNGIAASKPTEASASMPQSPLEWRFSQVFGDHGAGEDIEDGACIEGHWKTSRMGRGRHVTTRKTSAYTLSWTRSHGNCSTYYRKQSKR